ncbi:MAG TPA: hypothetical protein VGS20_12335 [Candidatus Acidoferrales bacterium]|nr:hypothetical protein [Candidatus Acidoferrales bacterium]
MPSISGKILRCGAIVMALAATIWLGATSRAQNQPALLRPAAAGSGGQASNPLAQLHFRFIGPIGGRTSAITGVAGVPSVAYVGLASGGIFKTTDSGTTWHPIFDGEHVAAIGALAVAPSAPNVVWAGTGEPWLIRAEVGMGDGIYKSTDAGRSWQHMGLDLTGHITGIVIDPQDANVVYACAVGQAYRPQPERGVFKSSDGGKTWQRSLFVNLDTGCSDLAMDPRDPDTLFAGMWQAIIHTWSLDSRGAGSGVYVTHDAGATWKKLAGNGLPAADHPVGRVSVAVAQTNPQRVYALLEDHPPGFYRSDDGGATWQLVSHSYALGGRMPYDSRFGVSTGDENLLYFLGTGWSVSLDGGRTLEPHPAPAGSDLHNIWIDPKDPNHFMVSEDTGGTITWNGGQTYRQILLPNAQMYHAYTDNRVPYNVYGNKQDGGSLGVPSNNLDREGGITLGDLFHAGACESSFVVPDPQDNNVAWITCSDGDVGRLDMRTGESRLVSPWPDAAFGEAPANVKYRFNWTIPIAISPHDHNRVYVGSQYLMATSNGGQSWQVISPDLTLNEKSHEQTSGGVTPYNLFTFEGETIFAIAESPVQAGVIWAGTSDGQVQITRDNGGHWANLTKNISGLPPWGTVENIEPSHFDAGTAYAAVNLEQVGDYSPYVYKTSDYGASWHLIAGHIPKSVFSFPLCVIEDPVRKGMLYLGTGNALYASWDDGEHWTQVRNNLPPAPVKWLIIQPRYDDLVMSLYGRGFWILDDLAPLREWDRAQQTEAYLFKPRPAYRYRYNDMSRSVVRGVPKFGENPPDGADINFYLRAPAADAQITIKGAKGEAVRTLKVNGRPGLNRVWWNLEYEPAHIVKLRTAPPDAPWAEMGPEGWRPYASTVQYRGAPRVPPGTYTVELAANGKQLSEPLVVLRDPNGLGTDQSIGEEVAFSRAALGELNQTIDTINRLEWDRKQVEDLEALLASRGGQAPLRPAAAGSGGQAALEAAKALDRKAIDLESRLIDFEMTGGNREEAFSYPTRLYERLVNLLEEMGHQLCCGGNGGSAAGLAPTDQEIAVNKLYQQELAEAERAFREFTDKDVPAFNATLKANHVAAGIAP